MKVGKLPHDVLRRLLRAARCDDARVVVGPAIGEDAAVLAVGDKLLVASIDPITFASDLIGGYAVQVNANDVAVMGAQPAWFLATLLLPEDAPESLAEEIFTQVLSACREHDICLVGGHTEVTHGLGRPLVMGVMLGEAERAVRSSGARPGDCLVLTKGIAIEGTAPIHAMHDPTEGGLATALAELGEAAGVGVRVRRRDISVLRETELVCSALGLDPLGLLASGSLLIAVDPADCERVISALRAAGIPADCVGEVVSDREVSIIDSDGSARSFPHFERDELARCLSAGADK